MMRLQKCIKYLAIALAILIIVSMVNLVIGCFYLVSQVFSLKNVSDEYAITENFTTKNIDIELKYADLVIQQGQTLKLTTNKTYVSSEEKDGTLIVKESRRVGNLRKNKSEVLLEIPSDIEYENVIIEAGAGTIIIKSLNTKELSLELGAGVTTIEDINVKDKCSIESGAGKLTLSGGIINNLSLDMGIGEANIEALLTGDSNIDSGIGKLGLQVLGKENDYKLNISKGIGDITLNGKVVNGDYKTESGKHSIVVNGDIGLVDISFLQDKEI